MTLCKRLLVVPDQRVKQLLLLGFDLEVMTRMPVQLQPYQPLLILELLGDLLLVQKKQMKLILLGSRARCCGFSARYRYR
jgi:hypothetical protein